MNKIRLLVSPWSAYPFRDAAVTRAALTQPYCTGTSTTSCEVTGGALDFTRVNLDHFVAGQKTSAAGYESLFISGSSASR